MSHPLIPPPLSLTLFYSPSSVSRSLSESFHPSCVQFFISGSIFLTFLTLPLTRQVFLPSCVPRQTCQSVLQPPPPPLSPRRFLNLSWSQYASSCGDDLSIITWQWPKCVFMRILWTYTCRIRHLGAHMGTSLVNKISNLWYFPVHHDAWISAVNTSFINIKAAHKWLANP